MALSLAAQSNAIGVSCLVKGECRRAFSFFNEALQRCNLAAIQAEGFEESFAGGMQVDTTDDSTAVTVLPQQMECAFQDCSISSKSQQNDHQHPISLLNQPLLFTFPSNNAVCVPGISVVSSCTATVMFNMALSLCQGDFSQRRKAATNAVHLYKSAVSLMEQLPKSSTETLVTVASLNNMSCVYYLVGDLELSKSCAESLMQTLTKVKQQQQQQQHASWFHAQGMDDLILGAVCVSGIRVAPAA